MEFISRHNDVDIFCFQEVYNNPQGKLLNHYPTVSDDIFAELHTLLPNHQGYFRPVIEGVYGIAIFIKKELNVLEEGDIIIHECAAHLQLTGHHTRNLQWITLTLNQEDLTVINVHGLWNGMGKTDTPDRLAQ